MRLHKLVTSEQKIKGVLGRESLEDDEVFVFYGITHGDGFHMQGVKFPIDIAFLDVEMRVLKVATLLPTVGRISSPIGTRFAVEAKEGSISKNPEIVVGEVWKPLYNQLSQESY